MTQPVFFREKKLGKNLAHQPALQRKQNQQEKTTPKRYIIDERVPMFRNTGAISIQALPMAWVSNPRMAEEASMLVRHVLSVKGLNLDTQKWQRKTCMCNAKKVKFSKMPQRSTRAKTTCMSHISKNMS